uniref:Uncharacterized protein n=1 Tax=Tanacetum cinerariifolium TaxID=118510 RepID=A0A699HAX3_TANCI|nr:hypothetical protein [Tanacetum cinerariifolium]
MIAESSSTESKEQDTRSRLRNDAHDDVADIRPIYDEEPMAEVREAASVKPHHMIASSNSRISSKNISRFTSNDMVYNHYLEEAKKKTQECNRNLEPSLMPSARSQSTANEVSSRAKVPSNKTPKRNKPIEQISVPKKQERQIPTGHRFSIQKTSFVQKKTMTPRSCLRWKPTGKIFNAVGLRWVPIGKISASSTTKVDSKPLNGSNADITNQYECEQTLYVCACTLNLSVGTSFNPKEEGLKVYSELRIHDHDNEQSSLKLVPYIVPLVDKTATSRQELELKFHHHIIKLRKPDVNATKLKQAFKMMQSVSMVVKTQDCKVSKDDQDKRIKIERSRTKRRGRKTITKGERSKITKHEGKSLQH